MSWCAVVPVKTLASAKSRLHSDVTSDRLALAFAQDTIRALLDADGITRVVVTTSDPVVATWAGSVGAEIHDDSRDAGINAAVHAAAASHAQADERIAVVLADLPCLTPEVMHGVLVAAASHQTSFLADAEGTGTTMWLGPAGTGAQTHFGRGSRMAHADSGAFDLARTDDAGAWATARRDVDTAADLASALALGVGPHTRTLVEWRDVVEESR